MPNVLACLWLVEQQGAQKPKGPLEALRPKLQVLALKTVLFFYFKLWAEPTIYEINRSLQAMQENQSIVLFIKVLNCIYGAAWG